MLRKMVVLLSAGLVSLGCGESSPSSEAAQDADASRYKPAPKECEGTNPFDSADCGEAISRACRRFETESECTRQPLFELEEGDMRMACAWSRVVRFAELESCTVGAVHGRCEAVFEPNLGCGDPCADLGVHSFFAFNAFPATRELVETPCINSGLTEIAGPWSARSNQQTEDRMVYLCADNVSPAPPADLCGCAATACAVRKSTDKHQ